MTGEISDIAALLDSDPAAGILAAADALDRESALISLSTPDMPLIDFLRVIARRWRAVVERDDASVEVIARALCQAEQPCAHNLTPRDIADARRVLAALHDRDLTATAADARAYLGGAP